MPTASRVVRTTAFKLTLIYLSVFAVLSIGLIGYISLTTSRLLDSQIETAINGEIEELSREFDQSGLFRVMRTIERRATLPDSSIYLILDRRGRPIAGNVAELSYEVERLAPDVAVPLRYARFTPADEIDGEPPQRRAVAKSKVMGAYRLLVGRDVEDRIEFSQIIRWSIRGAIVVVVALALVSWVFLSRSVLGKVDAIAASSRQIVAGDLTRRLPTDRSGDEFDRLAQSVNAMLDAIERLQSGLQEVSQNIAHDLKTPLTRVRNRLDDLLRDPPSAQERARLMGAAVEDCDTLIRTFDALLTIARVESHSAGVTLEPVDLSTLVADIAEFYEPAAEEAGMALTTCIAPDVAVQGEATLLRNLVANLMDNALKYGAQGTVELGVRADGDRALLTVRDQGPGVPAADRARLTDRFVRLDASRSKPGAGLGLSLVKAIASHHGATLSLEDGKPGLRVVVAFERLAAG